MTTVSASAIVVRNAETAALSDVPRSRIEDFRDWLLGGVSGGGRLAALFGQRMSTERIVLVGVVAHEETGSLSVSTADVGDAYPSLTPECPQAHWFEREIAEQWGIRPIGHPWLKPIRFHGSHEARNRSPETDIETATEFYEMRGEEVHEVAVGPVHAGVIEPGHFRFQCHGEHVFHLEIALGYQHRGVERALVGGPCKRSIHYMETLAGDTSVGHATAYCQALEALAGTVTPARAHVLRAVALELERLANHIGDLGALAGDIGFLPTAAYCGRLRGDFLNLTALMCGSRFGRGLVRPGGVGFDVDAVQATRLAERLLRAMIELKEATDLLWETPSVQARFEHTGILPRETAQALGAVGPVARASGISRDARRDFPSGIYRFAHIPVSLSANGDVAARAQLRWLEIQRSAVFVREQLGALPDGPTRQALQPLEPNRLVVSLVEGWRGEICHVVMTDGAGRIALYKVIDPSVRNWMALAMALRDEEISNFPLCNKSFNLSYCGHDL